MQVATNLTTDFFLNNILNLLAKVSSRLYLWLYIREHLSQLIYTIKYFTCSLHCLGSTTFTSASFLSIRSREKRSHALSSKSSQEKFTSNAIIMSFSGTIEKFDFAIHLSTLPHLNINLNIFLRYR